MSPVLHRRPLRVPTEVAEFGPPLAERVVAAVAAVAGQDLQPTVRAQLLELTLQGYDVYLAMLRGDEDAGGPERMAELTGHVFDRFEVSLEDAIALQRFLQQVSRQEVRELAERHLLPGQIAEADAVAGRFFNDLSAALTDGWLSARRQHAAEREEAEARLLLSLLVVPPRIAEARRLAHELRIDLAAPWEVARLSGSGHDLEQATTRLRQTLWGTVLLVAPEDDGLVVAVRRAEAVAPWPDLGPRVVCGIGGIHEQPRGLRQSHEQACEALDLAQRRRVPQLRFDDAVLDRFLLGTTTAAELAEVVLAPLAALTPSRRAVLLETLEAYLDCGGKVAEMVDVLHMHRQSVNYRVGNLRRVLGPGLRTGEGRLALHIAVKSAQLGPALSGSAP